MSTIDAHLRSDQLQLLTDGRLEPAAAQMMQNHLAICPACRAAAGEIARIDGALRRLPVESVDADFTRAVLARVGLLPRPSLFIRLAGHAAYLFGLLIVVATIGTVFMFTGVIQPSDVSGAPGLMREAVGGVWQRLATVLSSAGEGVARYLGISAQGDGNTITISLVAVVGLLALADRLWRKKFESGKV